jgi:hypothetical protein
MICDWCNTPFRPRRGGSPQRFCDGRCRTAFWSALRRWGERAIDAGVLTIDDIRTGDPTACTLLPGARSDASVDEAPRQHIAPVALREESRCTGQRDLEAAMAEAIAMRRR